MSDLPRGGEEVAQTEQAGVETVMRYQCSSCFLRYDTVTEFSHHDCDPTEHRITCDGGRCKQVCANRVDFVRHFAAEHTRKRAEGEPERVSEPCRVCNVKYRVGDELLRHWDTHGKAFHTNEKRLMTVVETPVEPDEEEAAADAADAAYAAVDAPVDDDDVHAAPVTAQAADAAATAPAASSATTEDSAAAADTTVHVAAAVEAVAATCPATPDNAAAASIPGESEATGTAESQKNDDAIEPAAAHTAAAANGLYAATENHAAEAANGDHATESTAKSLDCHFAAAAGTSNADSTVAAASHTADASETTDETKESSGAEAMDTAMNSCRKRGTTEEPTNGVDPKRTRMETRDESVSSTSNNDHAYCSGSSLHSSSDQQSRSRTPQLSTLLSIPVAHSTPLRASTRAPGASTTPIHPTPSKPSSTTSFIPSGSGSNAYRASMAEPSSASFQPPPGYHSTATRPVHQYPSTPLAPVTPSKPRLSPSNARATAGAYPPPLPTTANALASQYDSLWFRRSAPLPAPGPSAREFITASMANKSFEQVARASQATPRPAPPPPPTRVNSALVEILNNTLRRSTPSPSTSSNPSIPELLAQPRVVIRGNQSTIHCGPIAASTTSTTMTPHHPGVAPPNHGSPHSTPLPSKPFRFIPASQALLREKQQAEHPAPQPRPLAPLEEATQKAPATAAMPTPAPIEQLPQLPAVKAEAVDAAYPIPQIPASHLITVMYPTSAASAIPLSICTTPTLTVPAPLRSVKQEMVDAADATTATAVANANKAAKEALIARAIRRLNEEAVRAAVPAPATAATQSTTAAGSRPPSTCSMPALEAAVSPAPLRSVKQEVADAAAATTPTTSTHATHSAASPATLRVDPRLMQAFQDFTKSEAFAKYLTEAGLQTTSMEAVAAQAADALAAAVILPQQDAAAAVEANKDKEQDDQEMADEHNESNEHGSDTASIAAGEESPIVETKHRPTAALEETAEEDQEQIPSSGSGHSGSESTAAEEAVAQTPRETSFAEVRDEPMDTDMDAGSRPSSSLDNSYAHAPPANEPMDDDFHYDLYEFDDEDEEDEVMPCRSGMGPDCDYVPGSDEERKLRRTARKKKKRPMRTAKRESVSRCSESSDDENVVNTRRKSTVRFAPKVESGEEEENERQPAKQPAERSDAETTPRSILKSSPRKLRSNGDPPQQAAAADSDDEPGPSRKRPSRATISSGDESSRSSSFPRKKRNKRQAAASSGDEDVSIRSRSARRAVLSSDDESAKELPTRRSSPRNQKKADKPAQQRPEAMSDDPSGIDEMATPPKRSHRSSSRKQIKNEPQSDESDEESEAPRSARSSKRRKMKREMESDEDEYEKNVLDAGVKAGRPRRSGGGVKQEEMEEADRKIAERLQGSDKRLRRSTTVRLEEAGEENEEDQEFWSGKTASNKCPRCNAKVLGSRKAHYRTFHYDAFYPLVSGMHALDKYVACRLGGISGERVCLHCTDGVKYDGRMELLKHIKKVHRGAVFRDMSEAYRKFARDFTRIPIELQDIHSRIL